MPDQQLLPPTRPLTFGERLDVHLKFHPEGCFMVRMTKEDTEATVRAFKMAALGEDVIRRADAAREAETLRRIDHEAERSRYQRVQDRLQWLGLCLLLTTAASQVGAVLLRGVLSLLTELPQ